MGIPTIWVRQKVVGIPDVLLKGPYTHSFTQSLTLGSSVGRMTQEASEKYKDRLSCVAAERSLEGQLPFFLCRIFLCAASRGAQPFLY